MATLEKPAKLAGDVLLAAGRHPLTGRIAARLSHRCGVKSGNPVVIGVSGGADSLALLLACTALRTRGGTDEQAAASFSVEPIVCHVNHGLRDDATDDEQFVVGLCDALDVPSVVKRVDVSAAAGNRSAAARQLRYEAMTQVARDHEATAIAVAHHADDQFETILMHLCRGSGLDGLSGMKWTTPTADGVDVIRPLLDSRRSECESLCNAASLTWRNDPTNVNTNFARAHVRAEVIPILESLWPGAPERVTLTAELLDYAAARLTSDVMRVFGKQTKRAWPRADLQSAAPVVIAAGLRSAAVAVEPAVADRLTQSHLLAAADIIRDEERRPRRFDWPCGITLRVTSKEVSL